VSGKRRDGEPSCLRSVCSLPWHGIFCPGKYFHAQVWNFLTKGWICFGCISWAWFGIYYWVLKAYIPGCEATYLPRHETSYPGKTYIPR
jgi:hypothetical protein